MTDQIASQIRKYRLSVGMSQVELADAVGVSRNTIANYESGKTRPSVSYLFKMARALGCSMANFIEDADPPKFHMCSCLDCDGGE